MIVLKPDDLAGFAAFVQEMGERAVILVTPEGIEAFLGPSDDLAQQLDGRSGTVG